MPRSLPGVDESPTFFRVRMRQPGRFETCRTPQWARNVSESESKGSRVIVCRNKKGEWKVQSVLIRKGPGKNKRIAKKLGIRIRNRIEKQ